MQVECQFFLRLMNLEKRHIRPMSPKTVQKNRSCGLFARIGLDCNEIADWEFHKIFQWISLTTFLHPRFSLEPSLNGLGLFR